MSSQGKGDSLQNIVVRLISDQEFEKDFNFDEFFTKYKDFLLTKGRTDLF